MRTARIVITLGVCLALGSACGKKGSSGNKLRSGDAVLELPAGTDASALKVTVQPQVKLPTDLERFAQQMQRHLRLVKIVSIEPTTIAFATPADLTVAIAPAELPDKSTLSDVRAFAVIDGVPVDLSVEKTDDGLRTKLAKAGHVLFAVGPRDATLVGTPALVARGASEILFSTDCTKWLTPKQAKLTIAEDKTLVLEGAPKPVPYQRSLDEQHADQILQNGEADPIQESVVYGSVLLGAGYPVRLVGGEVTYQRDGVTFQGFHQWVETIVEGKTWIVDTTDPARRRLVPAAEARKAQAIQVHRACAAYPEGTPPDPSQWDR